MVFVHELGREVVDGCVALLGELDQDFEGCDGAHVVTLHDDALGLADDVTRCQALRNWALRRVWDSPIAAWAPIARASSSMWGVKVSRLREYRFRAPSSDLLV